ncbi:hypothetical protein O3M35_008972 [Rhynocoris fuscipes]|uniref:Nucleoporin NDC1 n=1 Tax=Rhynocoris fuscipes TaxID=488301 RepID=A0AAW1D1A4_9HEMI
MVEKKLRELCLKRILRAVIWNIFVQGVFVNVYLFLINIDIFHPLNWLGQWTSSLCSIYTWLYFIPLTLVIVAQGILCSRDYITLQPYYSTRFSFFLQMLSAHSQKVAFLHMFIGILIPWIYLSIASEPTYSRFIYTCSNGFVDVECFSEDRLFLILSCVTVNMYYLFDNYFLGARHLSFPLLQLPKLVQIKSQFSGLMREALPYTFAPNLLFMALYYCFGGNLRHFITSYFSLYFNSLYAIDTFQGLFSFKRLFYLNFLTVTTIASMKIMEMLFKVHLTERHVFPINQPVVDDNEILLKDALKCKSYPIIQHLAYLDLVMLSENDASRRSEIYKLSVPGGHPHVWNSIKNECLQTIDEFVDNLSSMLAIANKTKETSKVAYPQRSPLAHDQPAHKLPTVMKKTLCQQVSDNFFQWFAQKAMWFSNLPIIIYFFGELKEIRARFALRSHLIVQWSAHSLSFLACYSLTEDKYGIIQNDLNKIITTLLNLKCTLDSLEKYFSSVYKMPKGLASYQKAIALKKSVKRCIYRIARSFHPYIADLQLSKDAEFKMLSFVNYKE